MKFPEAGYTPANLRHLLEQRGWTQAHAAGVLGVSPQTLRRWVADVNTPSRTDMPHEKWLALLQAPDK